MQKAKGNELTEYLEPILIASSLNPEGRTEEGGICTANPKRVERGLRDCSLRQIGMIEHVEMAIMRDCGNNITSRA